MNDNLDFVAIGDTTTYAFIRIKQAHVHQTDGEQDQELCLVNGSKIPYEFVKVIPAVGNSANAAVAAARLGLRSALVADVGGDEHGTEDIDALKANGVITNFVKIHADKTSNYHYVLWYKAERTILIKHEEYEYKLPDIGTPKWMYFSSVGENSLLYHKEIAEYVRNHPSIKLAFQPGTFQIKLGYETLKELYELTEVFFCNKEEAQIILKTKEDNPATLAQMVEKLGPKISVITDGPKGAYVYDGANTWFMPTYPDPAPPYERTGAGDAFSSTFTSALALGKSVEDALRWGPINSMSVVQKIGAQEGLLSQHDLLEYLKTAPADYQPKKI